MCLSWLCQSCQEQLAFWELFTFAVFGVLQAGSNSPLHASGTAHSEDVPYGDGAAALSDDTRGYHHHPGLHQGHAGAQELQKGMVSPQGRSTDHKISSKLFPSTR